MEEENKGEGLSLTLSEAEKPYRRAMSGKWESLKDFYKEHPKEIPSPMTTNNDTALHVVASSGPSDVLEHLISLLKEQEEKQPPTDENQPPMLLRRVLKMMNYSGNTPLHEAAASGNLSAAELLVNGYERSRSLPDDDDSSNKPLVEIRNKLGESPLYRAAACGHTNLVEYFLSEVDENGKEKHFQRKDRISILQIAVITQNFETAIWLQKKYTHLANIKESNGLASLQLLAQMPYAFEAEFHKSIWKMLIYKRFFDRDPPNQNNESEGKSNQPTNQKDDLESGSPNQNDGSEKGSNQPRQSSSSKKKLLGSGPIGKMFKEMQNQTTLSELTNLLVKEDHTWEENDLSVPANTFCLFYPNKPNNNPLQTKENADEDERETGIPTYKYTPLLAATCTGIFQIVDKILKVHPQAIETRHIETQENILHIAIKYRRLDIFKIVTTNKTKTSRLAYMIDKDGNSILHHAASTKFYTVDTERASGPALQLQEELRWMERVKAIMPPHYAMHKNNKGLTAQELFDNQHEKLHTAAKEWMKGTAQSCSTVAALVATVAYAAAFTAPGGNNGNGVPVLRHSPFFVTFTVSDTVSLVCSLTSLCTFLSILTSPFEYENFHHSLPWRLHFGFFLLFFSLVATMLTFTATVALLIHHPQRWTTSFIYVVALLPVSVFGLLQISLYDGYSQGLKYISHKMRRPNRRSE